MTCTPGHMLLERVAPGQCQVVWRGHPKGGSLNFEDSQEAVGQGADTRFGVRSPRFASRTRRVVNCPILPGAEGVPGTWNFQG